MFNSLKTSNKTQKSVYQSQIFPADKIVGEQVFPKDRLTVEASVFPPDSYVTPAAEAQTDGNAEVYAFRPAKSDDLAARAA